MKSLSLTVGVAASAATAAADVVALLAGVPGEHSLCSDWLAESDMSLSVSESGHDATMATPLPLPPPPLPALPPLPPLPPPDSLPQPAPATSVFFRMDLFRRWDSGVGQVRESRESIDNDDFSSSPDLPRTKSNHEKQS